MNIYVYSDESGVFDKMHNDYFVYGGIILIGKEDKEIWSRKYSGVEKIIRKNGNYSDDCEIKATAITNKEKNKLFRSLNDCYKFGAIVRQKKVLDNIFKSKKDKQRYLDYVYKIAVKNAFKKLIEQGVIVADEVNEIHFFADEHSTATNGRYELAQALESEFKYGTYNWNYSRFFPPILKSVQNIQVDFCNSEKKTLIRAADIVANKIYHLAISNEPSKLNNIKKMFYTIFP